MAKKPEQFKGKKEKSASEILEKKEALRKNSASITEQIKLMKRDIDRLELRVALKSLMTEHGIREETFHKFKALSKRAGYFLNERFVVFAATTGNAMFFSEVLTHEAVRIEYITVGSVVIGIGMTLLSDIALGYDREIRIKCAALHELVEETMSGERELHDEEFKRRFNELYLKHKERNKWGSRGVDMFFHWLGDMAGNILRKPR